MLGRNQGRAHNFGELVAQATGRSADQADADLPATGMSATTRLIAPQQLPHITMGIRTLEVEAATKAIGLPFDLVKPSGGRGAKCTPTTPLSLARRF